MTKFFKYLILSLALIFTIALPTASYPQSNAASNVAKLRNIIVVTDPAYGGGAKCDGSTNDTTALQKAFDAITDGTALRFPPSATCMHAGYLNVTSKSHFSIIGNGTTLKTVNGTAIASGNGGLKFVGSSYGNIAGLIIDGNRANRTPVGEPDSMGVHIGMNSSFLTFDRVYVRNSVSDGWMAYQNTGTAPADIQIIDSESSNAWRNGMSIVGATRLKVVRGRYYRTNGTNPQTGIDIETDVATANVDIEVIGARVDSNTGYGVQIGGPAATNNRVSLIDVTGTANTLGLLNAGAGDNIKVRNLRGYSYSSNPTRAVVDFGTGVNGLDVDGIWLKDLTFTGVNFNAVYFHSTITGRVSVRNIGVDNFGARGVTVNTPDAVLSGVTLKNGSNASVYAFHFEGATRGKVTDLTVDTVAGGAIYISAANATVDGAKLHNVSHATQVIKVDTGGDYVTLHGIEVTRRTAKPGRQTAMDVTPGVLIKQINGFTAKDNASGYTSANIFVWDRTSLRGSKIDNVSPDPLH